MPTAKMISIPDDVKEILQDSVVTEQMVQLPATLPRDVYVRVDKILKAIGLKWNKALGGHYGAGLNPAVLLADALDTGKVLNKQQTYQEFFTPGVVVDRMIQLSGLQDLHDAVVLEPSAGNGAIACEALDYAKHIVCCEIQPVRCEELRKTMGFTVIQGDFMDIPITLFRPFDAVLMNPPFTNKQWRAHVWRAYEFLKPGGRLVAVLPGNAMDDPDFYQWSYDSGGKSEPLPTASFKEAGTKIDTILFSVTKEAL